MTSILIKTDSWHKPQHYSAIFALLYLKHQATIAIKKSGYIGKLNFRSTSHGIVLNISGPQVNCTINNGPTVIMVINRPKVIKISPLLATLSSQITL